MLLYKKNIIHRDIKPENIMIKFKNNDNSKLIPKINDYGLSREIEEYASTTCGTPIYMAPEIFLKKNMIKKWVCGVLE